MNNRESLRAIGQIGGYTAVDTGICKWADERIEELERQLDANHVTGNVCKQRLGMTLRDYFAAKAMQGLVAADSVESNAGLAKISYMVADAMLEARK
jgi:hypothetical protein